jgi:mRNA-degrading endonuclease RelE of RelBE toxin-antitoxin system
MELIETPVFTRQVTSELDPDEYRQFQLALLTRPEAGRVIRHSGGLRKMRWGAPGRGKRGGVRVIYYWKSQDDRIYLLFLYPKNVQSDLTASQLKILRNLVSDE